MNTVINKTITHKINIENINAFFLKLSNEYLKLFKFLKKINFVINRQTIECNICLKANQKTYMSVAIGLFFLIKHHFYQIIIDNNLLLQISLVL